MPNEYIAVDYHKKYSYIKVINQEGKTLREGKIQNEKEILRRFLEKYKEGKAVMEATRNWTLMYDWLEEMTEDVVLAHPMKVKAIAEAKIKTDKIDAGTLGHLLRADLIPEAYVPDKDTRDIKNVLRQRLYFVRLQTMTKNRIHVLIDRHYELKKDREAIGEELFGKQGIEWLKKVKIEGKDKRILDKELSLLEELREQIKETDAYIRRLVKEDEEAKLVESIPGIGKFFAILIVKEIGEIGRFISAKKLCAYAGLVPSTYSSGGKTFHGRIIKQGNKWLRWAMVEAVWPATRTDQSLRELYWYYKKKGKSTNKAKVAVAKRLLTIVYKVLKEKRKYEDRTNMFQSL